MTTVQDIRVDDQIKTLADYLRNDKLFRSKNINGSNLRNLLIGLALEIGRAEGILQEINENYDPTTTELLIEEWEHALGIPDECFYIVDDIDQRRRNIVTKLTALGVSTKEGFEALAATFGYTLTVEPGRDALTFPLGFPILFTNLDTRFVMVVNMDASVELNLFTLNFPIPFMTNSVTKIITCLFENLAPANVKVIFRYS